MRAQDAAGRPDVFDAGPWTSGQVVSLLVGIVLLCSLCVGATVLCGQLRTGVTRARLDRVSVAVEFCAGPPLPPGTQLTIIDHTPVRKTASMDSAQVGSLTPVRPRPTSPDPPGPFLHRPP